MKENTGQVLVQAPTEIANYLLNEKRRAIVEIETRHESPILIVADTQLETPHFNVSRLREGELTEESAKPSYHRTTPRKLEIHSLTRSQLNIPVMPAVTHVHPTQPAPTREPREENASAVAPVTSNVQAKKPGMFARIAAFFSGGTESETSKTKADTSEQKERSSRNGNDRNHRNSRPQRDSRGNQQRPQQSRNQAANTNAPQVKPQATAPSPSPQQNKAPAPQAAKQAIKQETLEQAPVLDEAKQLELQQRAEELKRKEMERREAQRQESYRREAERKAKREAEKIAQLAVATTTPVDGEVQIIVDPQVTEAAAENGSTDDEQSAEGARRRRGRRGGRRRRRPDQGPQDPNAVQDENSAADFDDEDGDEEEVMSGDESASEQSKPSHVPAFIAPVLVSAMPVTRAESEFDDLDDQLSSENIAVAAPAPAAIVQTQVERAPVAAIVVAETKAEEISTPIIKATTQEVEKAEPVVVAFIAPKIEVEAIKPAPINIETSPKITVELPVTAELLAAAPHQEVVAEVIAKPVAAAAVSTVPPAFSAPAPVAAITPTPISAVMPPAVVTAPAATAPTAIRSVPPAFSAPAPVAATIQATPIPAAFTTPAPVAASAPTPSISSIVPPAFSAPAPAAFVAPKAVETLQVAQTEIDLLTDNAQEGDQQKLI